MYQLFHKPVSIRRYSASFFLKKKLAALGMEPSQTWQAISLYSYSILSCSNQSASSLIFLDVPPLSLASLLSSVVVTSLAS